jgi:hypothetical protein
LKIISWEAKDFTSGENSEKAVNGSSLTLVNTGKSEGLFEFVVVGEV